MSWKHEYLERAQRIIAMRNTVAPLVVAFEEADLEEDLAGKLTVWQCIDLLDWLMEMPYSQASGLLMALMPESVQEYHAEASLIEC